MVKDITSAVKNLKVSGDIMDLVLAGVFKYFAEKAIARIPGVGNGNVISGMTKLGIGVAIDMFAGNNRIAKVGKTAMVLDGVEDLTQYAIKMVMAKNPFSGNSNQIQTI